MTQSNKQSTPRKSFVLLTVVIPMLLVFGASTLFAKENSLTGVWKTASPTLYLIELTPDRPEGKIVKHGGTEILERSASLEWVLEERPGNLIVGTNHWIAFDENGEEVFRGSEPILGAWDGKHVTIIEEHDATGGTPQLTFTCVMDGPDTMKCLGRGQDAGKMMVISITLYRVQ